VGFLVDKVVLGQVFSEYLDSLANLHSTNFSTVTITYHPGPVQQSSRGRSTKGPTQVIIKNIGRALFLIKIKYDKLPFIM
jgi:hypothetical protein